MTKSIAIIGAGIAGLATGCYARMNGYDTRIFEMHDKAGGLCTAWQRHGYTVDGCIHWLVGSAPGQSYHDMWLELGAVQGREFVDHEIFARVEGRQGETFNVYTNLDRLERHMKDLSPADTEPIDDFINIAKTCAKYDMPMPGAPEVVEASAGLARMAQYGPFIRMMAKWRSVTISEFATRFADPFMREAFTQILIMDVPEMPVVTAGMTLGWMHNKTAGQPVGGSLEFARSIERRYLELGGTIQYRAPVREVVIEDNRAVGVRLANGDVHRADTVVSAADGHSTIYEMLGGRYVDDTVRSYYSDLHTFAPMVHVALGVARTFENEPVVVNIPLNSPVTLGGVRVSRLPVEFLAHDPTMAPRGKTVLRLMLRTDYDYWKRASREPKDYADAKEAVAAMIVSALNEKYKGFADQVEMRDVATPLSFERYTGNWRGNWGGWLITEKTIASFHMQKTLPGLDRFYMVGQWVEPGGGVPSVALSGRQLVEILCHRDGKKFATSVP